ncbi:HNH endonuclease [Novosphingobium sp. AP12]|uniref:HNH endonuclease n=1 Tax=Novosphingobium sp. AP12 TaxID=1144305 RepID=UPI000271E206|nr:hypothetical protein [Novosphingobium sp. AP12]EJL34462.1 hypothetical protein PMI02_00608 [Novosphingobium sp. AP12]
MPRKPWQRTGSDNRLRGRAGQKQRERRLARTNGLCQHCLNVGRATLETVVDHIAPFARSGEDVDDSTEIGAVIANEKPKKKSVYESRGIRRV